MRIACEVESIQGQIMRVKWQPSWRDKVQTVGESALTYDPKAVYDPKIDKAWFDEGAWCKRYFEIGDRCKVVAQETDDDQIKGHLAEVNGCDAQVIRWDYVEEKFHEENFRVCREMRILGKIKVICLIL